MYFKNMGDRTVPIPNAGFPIMLKPGRELTLKKDEVRELTDNELATLKGLNVKLTKDEAKEAEEEFRLRQAAAEENSKAGKDASAILKKAEQAKADAEKLKSEAEKAQKDAESKLKLAQEEKAEAEKLLQSATEASKPAQ